MAEETCHVVQVLSGTAVAKEIRDTLRKEVNEMQEKYAGYKPGLAILQVGDSSDSNVYIRMKMKILNLLKKLNDDPMVHGNVQMPLDCDNEVNSHLITDSVLPCKDVDGLHTINEGKLSTGDLSGFIPSTPKGVLELILKSGINIASIRTVVIGRSKILGTPVSELLKWHDATVTICDSKTKNISVITSRADILIAAIGRPEYVRGSWVKLGAVIDCSINSVEDKTKPSGKKIVGNVNYEEVSKVASYITPVPGRVGPMTVAMLMKNTVHSAQLACKKLVRGYWNLSILPLNITRPPPSDKEIVRSHPHKDISLLASEIGLMSSEISLYGNTKAKVSLSILKRLANQNNSDSSRRG